MADARVEVARNLPAPRPIVLDGCCLINLAATGRAEELLRAIARPAMIARYVYENEALFLRNRVEGDDTEYREAIDLGPLRSAGLIEVVGPESDAEVATFLTLATDLDDGEAWTGAAAIHRGGDVATDDKKGIRVLTAAHPAGRIWRTSELIKIWSEQRAVSGAELRDVLRNVEERARFRPGAGDPLKSWWHGIAER